MTFVLRPSTKEISEKLFASYQRNPKIALLTVKTGGGKTYAAIHTFGQMFNKCTLLVFTTDKVVKSGQWQASVKDYNEVMHTKMTIICNNYEKVLSQRFMNRIAQQLTLVENQPIVLVLDEIHRIKLSSSGKFSKRAKILIKLAKQPYITTILGLSATAFSNSYLDVAPYLIMAGYYKNKSRFMEQQVKYFNKFRQPVVKDRAGNRRRDFFKNPDKIDWELKNITTYVDTSNYMPDLDTHHIKFELSNPQKAEYDKIDIAFKRGDYDTQDKDGSMRPGWMTARSKQEQLLASKLAMQKDQFVLNVLKRQQDNEFNGIHPVIIFYEYTIVCNHLKELLRYVAPEYNIVIVNGQENVSQADMEQPSDLQSIYLVQYEAGGEGLDWQWSNISIFYEAPIRYEKFVQAKGRNLRNKSLMPKVYHFSLEYQDTYDSNRWDTNREKKNFTQDVSRRTFLQNVKRRKD